MRRGRDAMMRPRRRIAVTTNVHTQAIVRGRVEAMRDGRLVLAVPGTAYKLDLVSAAGTSTDVLAAGNSIRGTIEARALRVHTARGGGRFIEPIEGAPRIVAGAVLAVDGPGGRVLVNAAVPMWVSVPTGQAIDAFSPGDLVNFYVESGATFTPI
jgi:hypothetical protein